MATNLSEKGNTFLDYARQAVFTITLGVTVWLGSTVADLNTSVKVLASQVAELTRTSQTQLQDHETRLRNLEAVEIDHASRIKTVESIENDRNPQRYTAK